MCPPRRLDVEGLANQCCIDEARSHAHAYSKDSHELGMVEVRHSFAPSTVALSRVSFALEAAIILQVAMHDADQNSRGRERDQ